MATVKKEPTVKKATKKVEVKAEVKITVPQVKAGSLSVPMITLSGKSSETFALPKEIFGAEINKSLLSQAIRVYSTNLQAHWGNTKTRGEVSMTTAKWFRQKGTGNARHGAKSAPIFVKGGIALGPKYRKTILELPKKMRQAALISALSQKVQDGGVMAFGDLENASGKTKQMAGLVRGLEVGGRKSKSVLIVADQKLESASRAVKNLHGVNFLTVAELNAYEVVKHHSLLLTKAAVERLQNPVPHSKSAEKEVSTSIISNNDKKITKRKAAK